MQDARRNILCLICKPISIFFLFKCQCKFSQIYSGQISNKSPASYFNGKYMSRCFVSIALGVLSAMLTYLVNIYLKRNS